MNSPQRSQPLLLKQEHQTERGWWLLGGEETKRPSCMLLHHTHLVWSSVVCPALWAGASAMVLLAATAASRCDLQVVVTASPRRLGPVLACPHLPPSDRPRGLACPQWWGITLSLLSWVWLWLWKIASVHHAVVPANSLYWSAVYILRNETCVKNW